MDRKNCAAPMRLVTGREYFVCDHCTTFHFPKESDEGVLGQATDLHCPVCGFVAGRYRAPIVTLVSPLAIWALALIVAAARQSQWLRLSTLSLAAAASLAFCFYPMGPRPNRTHQYYAFGNAALQTIRNVGRLSGPPHQTLQNSLYCGISSQRE